jgi:hypothetical protein
LLLVLVVEVVFPQMQEDQMVQILEFIVPLHFLLFGLLVVEVVVRVMHP